MGEISGNHSGQHQIQKKKKLRRRVSSTLISLISLLHRQPRGESHVLIVTRAFLEPSRGSCT